MALGGRQYFAGSMGDIGCFSFFPSKTLGAYGDGGLVTSADEALGQKLRTLRTHGESEKYHHAVIGINSRLDSIQAAVLAVKQHFLDAWCAARIARARAYAQLFVAAELLGADKVIAIPEPAADSSHVFNNYVIRVARRDSLKSFLRSRGIQSEIYYPVALHLQKCFAGLGYGVGDFPNAELAARQVLALPLYPELHLEQQQFIVNSIEEFFRA
jgi:dTDP-4-amino-4,6-dideoxygalactose transaminase